MAEWIISCDAAEYDIDSAFETLLVIDWKQSTNVEVDDIVYIYITKPVQAIRYKCVVLKVNMEKPEIDDADYAIDGTVYDSYGRYMQLQLLSKYDSDKLKLTSLEQNGLKTVQGPTKVTPQLSAYLYASTETLTGKRISRRKAIEILIRAYDRPVTPRELTNIIYEVGKHQSSIFGELNYMTQIGELTRDDLSEPYHFDFTERQPTPQYFYVFQNRSFEEEYQGGFLWAPKQGKGGTRNHHWSRMEQVKKGDVILHGRSGRFIAVSIAKEDCYEAPRPNNLSEEWARDGWRVDTEYFVFPHAIRPVDYWDSLCTLQPSTYSPFNRRGGGNQGYLFEANQEMARFLLNATGGLLAEDAAGPNAKFNPKTPIQKRKLDVHFLIEKQKRLEEDKEEDRKLIENLKEVGLPKDDEDLAYSEGPRKKPDAVYQDGHKIFPRNQQIAVKALKRANYLCEIDRTHPTFIRKKSDVNYTEPHHLVPMAFSDDFPVALDREQNIVSLCSNCHNQIHYGKEAEKLLQILYTNRKEKLKEIGVDISFEKLLAMYNIEEA